MGNLAKHAELVQDSGFRTRVQAAAVQAAVNVSGESTDPTDARSQVRQAYAGRVLDGSVKVDALAWAVAANPTILGTYVDAGADEIPDGDIEYVMSTVWDDLSGAARIPAAPAPPA